MGGLCAIASLDGAPVPVQALSSMLQAVPHRGTARSWQDEVSSLAHLGSQSRDRDAAQLVTRGGIAVTADARLDNREELVPWLMRRSYLAGDAPTTSDAEIVLAAHRCWGSQAPARLLGDFAYVIWNRRERRLSAARDPMGMRPLYYRLEPQRRIILASEIKQLLTVSGVPCAIDERGLVATLAGPYLPADATVYEGIDQLAPGETLIADKSSVRTRRFWAPDAQAAVRISSSQAADEFRARFMVAVSDRMSAGHETGLLLSGGLDSGSIAATAGWLQASGRMVGSPLRTYSWAFRTMPAADERAISNDIVTAYGLKGCDVGADDLWPLANFPEHGPDRDDPYMWVYQALHEQTLARCASDGVETLLLGDRGDELLGDWVHDELGLLTSRQLVAGLRELRWAKADLGSARSALMRVIVRPALHSLPRPLARSAQRSSRQHWAPWIPSDLARRVNLEDMVANAFEIPSFDGYARSLRYQRLFHPQMARIATLRERSMAQFGITYADPFTDRRLIELVLALPQWQVQRRRRPKLLGREAMRGIMPESARSRASKTIPHALFDRGLREQAVKTVRSLLTNSVAASNGWLDTAAVERTYEEYLTTGTTAHDFWWPIAVEWWLRRWWT